jgi:broad specificity phosphatase PhoE
MIMKLIITRHGETKGNVKRILADIDDPLTAKGKEQARKVAERLKDEKIDAIFSSPIIRAKETAQIIAKYHPKSEFIIADELKEMELGSYLNKGFDEVDWDDMPKDVESRTSMFKRGKSIVENAIKKYPNGTVLFVSHNAMNKAIIRYLRKCDPEERKSMPQGNTAITIFEITKKGNEEILFNCMKHLE